MKKIFTLFAATALFAGVAFAQETSDLFPTDVTFSSPDGTIKTDPETDTPYLEMSTRDTKVYITLDKVPEVVGVTPMLMIVPGTADFTDDAIIESVDPTANPIEVTLDASKWSASYMGDYYTTIMLTYVDAEGEFVLRDDEPIFFQIPCICRNTNPAEFVYASPNGTWEEGENFADAYRRGEITFAFNNDITFDNEANIGTITYDYGDQETVTITNYTSDWSRLDGYWAVTFNFSNSDLEAEDLSKIVINLTGVKSVVGNSPVQVPTITLNNTPVPQNAPYKIKSRMAEDLTNGNELVNIYNVQGILVKESANKSAINELPAGIYIVDGKKIVVR